MSPGDRRVEPPEIADCLRTSYGLTAARSELLEGGLDEAAWTYRVTPASGPDHVLRVKQGTPRSAAYLVPRHLRDAGAEAVVAPIPTVDQRLFVERDGLTWSLFPFVSGQNGYVRGMTAQHWHRLGAALRAVHDVPADSRLSAVTPREDFNVAQYDVLASWGADAESPDEAFTLTWNRNHATIAAMHEQLRRLAEPMRDRPRRDVVCHGDLHPGNVLIDGERVHIIDWDDVLLAPPERDFIFAPHESRAAPAPSPASRPAPTPLGAPFFDGYDLPIAEVDWMALTYYRCERVVQDVIAWAGDAFGKAAADAETEEAGRWLQYIFESGDEPHDAIKAACYLPEHLDVLTGRG